MASKISFAVLCGAWYALRSWCAGLSRGASKIVGVVLWEVAPGMKVEGRIMRIMVLGSAKQRTELLTIALVLRNWGYQVDCWLERDDLAEPGDARRSQLVKEIQETDLVVAVKPYGLDTALVMGLAVGLKLPIVEMGGKKPGFAWCSACEAPERGVSGVLSRVSEVCARLGAAKEVKNGKGAGGGE